MIYQNGEWSEWFMYMYNQGNEVEHLTGGWVSYGTPPVKKNANSIYLVGGSNVRCIVGTKNQIDLTNINTLFFDIDVTGASSSTSLGVGVNTKQSYDNAVSSVALGASIGRRVVALDVSAVSGMHYIYCDTGGSANCNGYLYKCWGV
jgi:hypothetical protein